MRASTLRISACTPGSACIVSLACNAGAAQKFIAARAAGRAEADGSERQRRDEQRHEAARARPLLRCTLARKHRTHHAELLDWLDRV
jgi:hypothetical protein